MQGGCKWKKNKEKLKKFYNDYVNTDGYENLEKIGKDNANKEYNFLFATWENRKIFLRIGIKDGTIYSLEFG